MCSGAQLNWLISYCMVGALLCSSSPLLDGLLKQTLEMISIVKYSKNLLLINGMDWKGSVKHGKNIYSSPATKSFFPFYFHGSYLDTYQCREQDKLPLQEWLVFLYEWSNMLLFLFCRMVSLPSSTEMTNLQEMGIKAGMSLLLLGLVWVPCSCWHADERH